ncbi:MAG TPA: hypothetical protein VMW36_05425 [Patescibacteria group bacterium]|nr:hypothetical protein [Patescibacteria group bacterium]
MSIISTEYVLTTIISNLEMMLHKEANKGEGRYDVDRAYSQGVIKAIQDCIAEVEEVLKKTRDTKGV